jgi:multidrug resistance efflux pump
MSHPENNDVVETPPSDTGKNPSPAPNDMDDFDDIETSSKPSLLRRLVKVAIVCLIAWAAWRYFFHKEESAELGTTFRVARGALDIVVLEGGTVEALESQEIKSEVQGQTKILTIVEEGYMVTPDDVTNGKVLVELDSKELVDKRVAQELEYQNALAMFTEAREEYGIQYNQNASDIKTAELAVKMARMDFQKYMGTEIGTKVFDEIGLKPEAQFDANPLADLEQKASTTDKVQQEASSTSPSNKTGPSAEDLDKTMRVLEEEAAAALETYPSVDFKRFATADILKDGDSGQMLRKLENDLLVAKKELTQAEIRLTGTKRLAERDFVTKSDLDDDQLKKERAEIAVQTAETAKNLYINYTFLKDCEKFLSDYIEARRKLSRAYKLAVSKMAKAKANLRSAQVRFDLQAQRLRELKEQIEKCIIKAQRSGLVVYGGGGDRYWGGEDKIEEGAMVRERQRIITIPDMTEMAVNVKVHESSIKMVQKDQTARITVDAFPGQKLTGKVVKVAVLPDSQNRWMNPDLKVYEVKVAIEGIYEWMKPGLSAEVQIMIKRLDNVLYVPLQAVVPDEGQRICHVVSVLGHEKRVIEPGEYNDKFIEIKKGLTENETVLLRAPITPESADASDNKKDDDGQDGEKGETKKAKKKKSDGESPAEGKKSEGPKEKVEGTSGAAQKTEATPAKAEAAPASTESKEQPS